MKTYRKQKRKKKPNLYAPGEDYIQDRKKKTIKWSGTVTTGGEKCFRRRKVYSLLVRYIYILWVKGTVAFFFCGGKAIMPSFIELKDNYIIY